MSGYRPEKIAEQIHREVSQLLMFNIKDPRVASVTLTAVKVSKDIGVARVYYTVSDEANDRVDAEQGLKRAVSYIRRELGRVMRLRSVPELLFQYDESVGYGRKIDALLDQVKGDLVDDHSTDS